MFSHTREDCERYLPAGHIPTFCERCGENISGARARHGLRLAYRLGVARHFSGTCQECAQLI